MMRAVLGGALIFAAVAGSPVLAGEVIYSFAGTVDADGIDDNGIFGTAGGSLSGLGFTAVYRWDPSIRPAALTRGVFAQGVIGGRNFGSPQAIQGLLTINGTGYQFGTDFGSLLRENGVGTPSSGGGFDQIGAQAYGNDPYLGITILQTIVSSDIEFLSDADLIGPLALTAAPVSRPLSSFYIARDGSVTSTVTSGALLISNFSVETIGTIEVAAVPEPMSWALMVVGFGLVGGVMRRMRPVGALAV